MNKLTDDLWALIRQFRTRTESEQRFAEQALLQHRSEVVPLLIEEVEEEFKRVEQMNLRESIDRGKPLYRLAILLAELSDARAIPVLAHLAPRPFATDFGWPLQLLLIHLQAHATRNDIGVLPWLLKIAPQTQPRKAVLGALNVLVALAERDPTPELRQALALIRPRFGELEIRLLRRRLHKVLSQLDLPIPAQCSQTSESLPLPSHSEKVDFDG